MVASEVFTALDDYMWKLTYKWATRAHPNKPRHWVTTRYYGTFNKSRQDQWVFGDRDSGAYLLKYAWTKIVRHQMVRGSASPDDPSPGDLLGRTAPHQPTTADPPCHPAPAPGAERAVSDLPGTAAARRRSAVQPHRVGTPLVLHCTPVSLSGLLAPSCGESLHGRF
ncbi:UNVERIFIED_CONTAM: hypothetical protein RKD50_009508 [Streptomyces canus]